LDDTLRTPDDLRCWGLRTGVLDLPFVPPGRDADLELAAARNLREHLHDVLLAMVEGRPPHDRDLRALTVAVAEAYAAGRLTATPEGRLSWQWNTRHLATVRHRSAESAVELLSSQTSQRLRRCPAPGCGWFFLDTTKNAGRRWCSMSGCGTRVKNANRQHHPTALP